MLISKYFSIEEFTLSDYAARHGIDNTPPPAAIASITNLCVQVLDPLRERIGYGVQILSGYRCGVLNAAIGGAKDSQHKCEHDDAAADTIVTALSAEEWFMYVAGSDVPFDQLIQEFDRWVHISFGPRNRREIIRAVREQGTVIYKKVK